MDLDFNMESDGEEGGSKGEEKAELGGLDELDFKLEDLGMGGDGDDLDGLDGLDDEDLFGSKFA